MHPIFLFVLMAFSFFGLLRTAGVCGAALLFPLSGGTRCVLQKERKRVVASLGVQFFSVSVSLISHGRVRNG